MISSPRSLNIQTLSPLRTMWIVAQRAFGTAVRSSQTRSPVLAVEAAELAVAVDAVDVVAQHQRRADHAAVQSVGVALVGAASSARLPPREFVLPHLQHQRAIVEGRDEEAANRRRRAWRW